MTTFPEHGRARADIAAALEAMAEGDADWRGGRVPLYVFGATQEVAEVGRDAFFYYFTENALGAKGAFTSIKRMEDEVLAMTFDLFHGPPGAVGQMTSGGTESILLAVKAARDWKRARRPDPRHRGNLVMAETAHPAFDKAAVLMDLPVRRVPVGTDLRADPATFAAAMDTDTIMLVGSVPCFPYGVVDPLPALAELALSRDVWLHVDACVGGYFAPFARDLGAPIPDFDFALAGVASLSADPHKFGFCPKPASTVFFRDAGRAKHAGFDLDVWPNGRFVTGTFVGTRPGGGVAAAWAVLTHLGREGYRVLARRLLAMRAAYVADIEAIPGMRVFGAPELSIIAFGNPALDIGSLAEGIAAARAWQAGQKPVVLGDFGDAPGGGAYGDGTAILAALIEAGVAKAVLACIWDPQVAAQAVAAGPGVRIAVTLGGRHDPAHGGGPIQGAAQVLSVSDDRFVFKGRYGTGSRGSFGPSAALDIGGVTVIVTSHNKGIYELEQLRIFGVEPTEQAVLVVRCMHGHRAEFEPISSRCLDVDSGGISSGDVSRFDWKKIPRPIWPLDDI